MTQTESQEKQIIKYLLNGGKLTPAQARRRFGSDRLSARIHRLKNRYGYDMIESRPKRISANKVVAQYYIPQ